MKCNFTFNLINPNKNSLRFLANVILVINALALLYFSYRLSASKYYFLRAGFIILLAFLDIALKRKDWLYHTGGVMIVFIGWLYFGYWWVGIIMIGLSVFAEFSSTDKKICFDESTISTTTIFGKTYHWNKLQNVILKEGLLTLDFKSNKLIQVTIEEHLDKLEEIKFNNFCEHCLQKHNKPTA